MSDIKTIIEQLGTNFTLTVQQDSGRVKVVVRGTEEERQSIQMLSIEDSPMLNEVIKYCIDEIKYGEPKI